MEKEESMGVRNLTVMSIVMVLLLAGIYVFAERDLDANISGFIGKGYTAPKVAGSPSSEGALGITRSSSQSSSSSTRSSSSSCDQTIDRKTGGKCPSGTKNCDCSGGCGSNTVCSSACSGCSGGSSSSASATTATGTATSSGCASGCRNTGELPPSSKKGCLKIFSNCKIYNGYHCACDSASQKICNSGHFAYDNNADNSYCCYKNGRTPASKIPAC